MEKEVIIKERVEKNLQVLKLLAKDDINISEKEKTEILKGYTGWLCCMNRILPISPLSQKLGLCKAHGNWFANLKHFV